MAALFAGSIISVTFAADWEIPDSAPLLTRWAKEVSPTNAQPEYGVATPGHDWPCEIWTYRSYNAKTDGTLDAMALGLKGKALPKLDQKSSGWFTREVARLYTP
jgi:hypothetical protein